jgi:hypothetical protein
MEMALKLLQVKNNKNCELAANEILSPYAKCYVYYTSRHGKIGKTYRVVVELLSALSEHRSKIFYLHRKDDCATEIEVFEKWATKQVKKGKWKNLHRFSGLIPKRVAKNHREAMKKKGYISPRDSIEALRFIAEKMEFYLQRYAKCPYCGLRRAFQLSILGWSCYNCDATLEDDLLPLGWNR